MNKVDFIKEMKVLKFEPGDIVVLKTDQIIGDNSEAFIKEIKSAIPEGLKVLLLEGGMDIGILRREDAC